MNENEYVVRLNFGGVSVSVYPDNPDNPEDVDFEEKMLRRALFILSEQGFHIPDTEYYYDVEPY